MEVQGAASAHAPPGGEARRKAALESMVAPPTGHYMVGGRRLSSSASAVLQHLQEHALRSPSEKTAQRLVRFFQCLAPRFSDGAGVEEPRPLGIDLNVVRSLCGEGIPDDVPALRAVLWKVMLAYLPADQFLWDDVLGSSRASYSGFVDDLVRLFPGRPGEPPASASGGGPGEDEAAQEELLGAVLAQIAKDVVRTRSELDLFGRSLDGTSATLPAAGRDPDSIDVASPRCHHDVLARVLLIYARLNPGVLYVQGMNELCAPIYYAFVTDPLFGGDAEADTFFCFTLLMSSMRDAFVKSLDDTDNGMMGRIDQFSHLLREKDEQVWAHLESVRISPVFYTVRWLTLMLAQELHMPDTIRLWDSLLSDFARPHPLLLYVCVAMVINIRQELLAGDMTDCMSLLQRYPPTPVEDLLSIALRLRAADLAPVGASHLDAAAEVGTAAAASAAASSVVASASNAWAALIAMAAPLPEERRPPLLRLQTVADFIDDGAARAAPPRAPEAPGSPKFSSMAEFLQTPGRAQPGLATQQAGRRVPVPAPGSAPWWKRW